MVTPATDEIVDAIRVLRRAGYSVLKRDRIKVVKAEAKVSWELLRLGEAEAEALRKHVRESLPAAIGVAAFEHKAISYKGALGTVAETITGSLIVVLPDGSDVGDEVIDG